MGKLRIAPGGGGADLDVITATAADLVAPKVIVDQNGEPVTGTMPDRGNWSSAELAAGASVTVPAGKHDGTGKVTAKSLASQTPGSLAANKMLAGTYGVSNGARVDGNIGSVGGPSITPQTYAQAISVGGKYVTGNGNVAGVALPPAAALKKGYRYWIGNNYVDGSFQGYVDSPLYLYNRGAWSNLQTKGMTANSGSWAEDSNMMNLSSRNYGSSAAARLNQTVNLTNYKYVKLFGKTRNGSYPICLAVSRNSGITTYNSGFDAIVYSYSITEGYLVLDVSALSGDYFIYVTTTSQLGTSLYEILLTTT